MYGSTNGVASITPTFADNRGDSVDFTTRTRPTNLQLVRWLNQISNYMDVCLATNGFTSPVPPELDRAHEMITLFVELEAAALVEGVNGLVKVSTRGNENNVWSLSQALVSIRKTVCQWVEDNKVGLIDSGLIHNDPNLFLFPENDYDFIFSRNKYGVDS